MVTSNLLGGLGNYMFQITSAYSLALDNDDELIFNINDCLRVHEPISSYKNNILRNIKFVETPLPIKNTYSEPFFHYQKIPYKTNIKLHGYYQDALHGTLLHRSAAVRSGRRACEEIREPENEYLRCLV